MATYRLFLDEKVQLENAKSKLEIEYREAGKEIGKAAGGNCDWHDNFAFDDAQRTFGLIGEKLKMVDDILTGSLVLSMVSDNPIVSMGKKVSISIDRREKKDYIIGGYQTPIEGRISYNAPLIRAILGKEEGDLVYINLNGKKVEIEILEIEIGVTLD